MSKTKHRLLALLLAVTTIVLQVTTAYADNGIADVEELTGTGPEGENNLSDGGRYMSNKYRDNYWLDIEELGIMDMVPGAGSFLANAIFSLDRIIVQVSAFVFYQCNTFRLAELLQGTLNNVQKSLKDQIYNALLPFAVIALGVFCVQSLVKHNGQAIVGQTVSFFGVMLMAMLLTTQTASVVAAIDNLTMGVMKGVVNAVYNVGSGKDSQQTTDYAADVAGAMWDTLVHRPWVTLNLDGDDDDGETLLSLKPHSQERQDLITKKVESTNNTLFTKDKPAGQVSLLIFYTVPLVIKCVIYICIGGLQLAFRVFTVVIMLFGIIIMLLALIPQLGGSGLIWGWCRKILGIQMNIIVLSLVLSVIMLADKLLYDYIAGWGWIIVIMVQAVLCIVIFMLRDQIFSFSNMVSRVATRPEQSLHSLEYKMAHSGSGIYGTAQAGGDFVEGKAHARLDFHKERFNGRMEVLGARIIADREHGRTPRQAYYASAVASASTKKKLAPPTVLRPRLYADESRKLDTVAAAASNTASAATKSSASAPSPDLALAPASTTQQKGRNYADNAATLTQAAERRMEAASVPSPTVTRDDIERQRNKEAPPTQQHRTYGATPITIPATEKKTIEAASVTRLAVPPGEKAKTRQDKETPPPRQRTTAVQPERHKAAAAMGDTVVPTVGRGTSARRSAGEEAPARTRPMAAQNTPTAVPRPKSSPIIPKAEKGRTEAPGRTADASEHPPKRSRPKTPPSTPTTHPPKVKP